MLIKIKINMKSNLPSVKYQLSAFKNSSWRRWRILLANTFFSLIQQKQLLLLPFDPLPTTWNTSSWSSSFISLYLRHLFYYISLLHILLHPCHACVKLNAAGSLLGNALSCHWWFKKSTLPFGGSLDRFCPDHNILTLPSKQTLWNVV